MNKEDKSFEKFTAVCYILAFISFLAFIFVWAYGVPNFSNINEERVFCFEQGGFAIEPSRQTYNNMICIFDYNGTVIEYVAQEVVNDIPQSGFEVGDYCFTCWDSQDCASPHNDILREKGVHC